jgi:hypothetical protein
MPVTMLAATLQLKPGEWKGTSGTPSVMDTSLAMAGR